MVQAGLHGSPRVLIDDFFHLFEGFEIHPEAKRHFITPTAYPRTEEAFNFLDWFSLEMKHGL
jgi:hypothetical protein